MKLSLQQRPFWADLFVNRILSELETVVPRKSTWRHATSAGTLGGPFGKVRFGAGATGRVKPAQSFGQNKGGGVAQAAILVFLQRTPLPRPISGSSETGKTNTLRFSPTTAI